MPQTNTNESPKSRRIESEKRVLTILEIKLNEDVRTRLSSPSPRLHRQLSMMFYNNFSNAMQMSDKELLNALNVYLKQATKRRTKTGKYSRQVRYRPCCSKYPGIFPFCDPRC